MTHLLFSKTVLTGKEYIYKQNKRIHIHYVLIYCTLIRLNKLEYGNKFARVGNNT